MRNVLPLLVVPATFLLAGGCADSRYDNTATVFDRPWVSGEDTLANIWLKTSYLYPGRDLLTFSWAGQALCGDRAWNVLPDGGVADGPFFTNREVKALSPRQVRAGPAKGPPPVGPWHVTRPKTKGQTRGFIGRDGTGRTFLVKFDHPDYPELGTSSTMIASRLAWLMGYHVPAVYLVTIEGTGRREYDGRRATASLFVPGKVVGAFKFDHYRMRRELRALRLVAAWLNDTDRVDNNTLVAVEQGRATCYLVDFNSCLGSWNGRPKEAWRGWRHAWDVEYQLLGLFTLGLLPSLPGRVDISSPAVGAYDLMTAGDAREWRPNNRNTAFDRLTPADAAWMAGRMAAASRAQLQAAVSAAGFSRPEDAAAVLDMLLRRRERVLQSWGLEGLLSEAVHG